MNQTIKSERTRIGLGLAAIGRPEYINIRRQKDPDKTESSYRQRAFDLLDFAYDKGIRDFDTAASYGRGEFFLQTWYNLHPYTDLKLSSKWGYTYVANWSIGYSDSHEVKEHSLSKLNEQWETAMKLLPGLKVYQIHSATFESGILENTEVLTRLAQIKKDFGIDIGISVSGEKQKEILERAMEVSVEGSKLFDSFQVTYNILETSTEDVLKELLNKGKIIIIKEALANGRLFRDQKYPHHEPAYNLMDKLATKHGVGIDAIALRFVMDQLKPNIVLSGASSIEQLTENLKAESINLDSDELRELAELKVDPEFYWSERKRLPWN